MRILGAVTIVALAAGLVAGLGLAPREATQGNVQRIMYLHVPSVWVAYLAFAVVFGDDFVCFGEAPFTSMPTLFHAERTTAAPRLPNSLPAASTVAQLCRRAGEVV